MESYHVFQNRVICWYYLKKIFNNLTLLAANGVSRFYYYIIFIEEIFPNKIETLKLKTNELN